MRRSVRRRSSTDSPTSLSVPFFRSLLWGIVFFVGSVFGDDVVLQPRECTSPGQSRSGNGLNGNMLNRESCEAKEFHVDNAYRKNIDELYDRLATVLKHHYQDFRNNRNATASFHGGDSELQYKSSSNVNLSPKVDSSLVRSQQYKNQTKLSLNVHNLTRVVEVNLNEWTVTVQARCTFDSLVQETLRYDAIPLVVPEFKSITVGGAIVGGALESSSYLYGQVSDTVESMQVLLANGTRVTVTPDTELYHALPGSYGSLAIVLEATLRIRRIPPASVVVIEATAYPSLQEGMRALLQLVASESTSQSPVSFIDATHYPSGELVIFAADLFNPSIDDKVVPIIRTDDSSSKWFYEVMYDQMHQQNSSSLAPQQFMAYMPIYDYLFRYERGAFWMGRPLEFSWSAIRNNPMLLVPFIVSWHRMRWLFGRMFTATILYRVLHALEGHAVAEKFLIQDAYVPTENVTKFVEWIRQTIPLSVPIWLCPVKRPPATQPLSPSGGNFDPTRVDSGSDMLINVGVWGRVGDGHGIVYMQELEAEMLRLGGRKMLYSITAASQMTAETLYEHHVDGAAYQELRTKYGAHDIFTPLHEKFQLSYGKDGSHPTDTPPRGWKYWLSRYLL
jgi:Delta24-sterol reductase